MLFSTGQNHRNYEHKCLRNKLLFFIFFIMLKITLMYMTSVKKVLFLQNFLFYMVTYCCFIVLVMCILVLIMGETTESPGL